MTDTDQQILDFVENSSPSMTRGHALWTFNLIIKRFADRGYSTAVLYGEDKKNNCLTITIDWEEVAANDVHGLEFWITNVVHVQALQRDEEGWKTILRFPYLPP